MYCVLYGSQTGQAKSIAEDIYYRLKQNNLPINIFELDEIANLDDIIKISVGIIVCSTTGDGDAPENAAKFLRKIKTYSSNTLVNLRYTVLGLGDSNYSNFCNCGKSINRQLEILGGKRFYNSSWADDAVGLEIVVEPWLDGLYQNIKDISEINLIDHFEKINIKETSFKITDEYSKPITNMLGDHLSTELREKDLTIPNLQAPFLTLIYDRNINVKIDCRVPIKTIMNMPASNSEVVLASVDKIEKITNKFAVKSVHKVILRIPNIDWSWNSGDSIGILPCNSQFEVESILDRLNIPNIDRDCPVEFKLFESPDKRRSKVPEHLVIPNDMKMSLRSILTWLVDLRQPLSKVGLKAMSDYCNSNLHEKRRLLELCSREGQNFYLKCLRETNMPILDLLNWFPSCKIPIERLLEFLPRLKPRAYSLCDLKEISFAFSKVDIAPIQLIRTRPLTGVCTTWLEKMKDDNLLSNVPIYLRKNLNGFTVCDESRIPHILIGPGTGVAPFISFLQHFENLKRNGHQIGPVWLFFGCRNEERDFIFKDQLLCFLKKNVLTHLCVCFSRDSLITRVCSDADSYCRPENCKYVQDCLLFHSQKLGSLVVDYGARIFVCGDSSGMSKDVLETWPKVLLKADKFTSIKDAESFITRMRVQKQYLEDVWL